MESTQVALAPGKSGYEEWRPGRETFPCSFRALLCDYTVCCGLSCDLNCPCLLFFSDRNSPCCKNCQFETAQKKCQEAINATCKGVSYCTGMPSCRLSVNTWLTCVFESKIMFCSDKNNPFLPQVWS